MSLPAKPLSIALLTHSTNPRGGVVHALELGEQLTKLGHDVTVHAPDSVGKTFFRKALCNTQIVPATPLSEVPAQARLYHMITTRIADYVRYFENSSLKKFDVYHAGDGISGNALATLKERGVIKNFARTVHHIDDFEDAAVAVLQNRAISTADEIFVVSQSWQDIIAKRFGRTASLVGNGVDSALFSPQPDHQDEILQKKLNIETSDNAAIFLSIGGIEERKNTLRALEAFIALRKDITNARWFIAGGASLLDHDAYQAAFFAKLNEAHLPDNTVTILGKVAQEVMPVLYRCASALLFPSVKEGFGLAVLEAMACDTPVIVSHIKPFTEYLGRDDVAWCNPDEAASITHAMRTTLHAERAQKFIARGKMIVAKHDWQSVAKAHEAAYARLHQAALSASSHPHQKVCYA